MRHVLLVGTDEACFETLKEECASSGFAITMVNSCEEAMAKAGEQTFDLVVVDETLADVTGLACVERLVKSNPLLNCAAITSLSSDDFHEASEGMGVLMGLPHCPGKDDVKKLLDHLNAVML